MPRTGVMLLNALTTLAVAAQALPASASAAIRPACGPKSAKRRPCPPRQPATPVTVRLLDGSALRVTTQAGDADSAALTGALRGVIKGGYKLNQTNVISLTTGHFDVAPMPLVRDDCTSPWAAATSALSTLGLFPPAGRIILGRTGDVTLDLPAKLRLVLDVRTGACGGATATTGYADTQLALTAAGKIVMGQGLAHLVLEGRPSGPTALRTCTTPGVPTAACAGDAGATTVTLTPHLQVEIHVG